MILFLDTETYNEHSIKNGSYRYAETVELLIVSYAIDDGEAKVWDVTDGSPIPADLANALRRHDVTIVAHNGGMFDRQVLRKTLPEFDLPPERWHDTMVQAFAHSLPGSLDLLSEIMGLAEDQRKLKIGKDLVRLFCQPRPKNVKVRRATRHTHPTEWAMFVEYARMDIVSMRELYRRLPRWNYPFHQGEYGLWCIDQRVNDRGVPIDTAFVEKALEAAGRAQVSLSRRARELTAGAVEAATQRDALLAHILEVYGVALPDMQASTLERRAEDPDLPQPVRDLIGVRLAASTTSVAKYKRLVNYTNTDGRLRGTLQFCGAGRTGRDAGRGPQFQNMPRPTLKQPVIELGIDAVMAGAEDLIFDNAMEVLSSAIRGVIKAPPGKKLNIADLSNIEGRGLSWCAGEAWKLKAFEDYDTIIGYKPDGKPVRRGYDLYVLAYSKAFGVRPEDVTSEQRQIGKVLELALGYEGGCGAFVTFATAYGIDLDVMADQAYDTLPADILGRAKSNWAWAKKQGRTTHGLNEKTWTVCESFKLAWREAHPNVVQFWGDLDSAFRMALRVEKQVFHVGHLKIVRQRNWVRIVLPSGRSLCYPGAKLDDKGRISYTGMNQYTRKWERLNTYGGKLAENVTQAISREVFFSAFEAIEAAGYAIVLRVHDELITETPDTDEYSAEGLAALMSIPPEWAKGFPLAAAGFSTYRYKKGD